MNRVVSYLVASFNHEKYLLDCLESIKADILGLLSASAEVVLIDDGSIDGSVSIVDRWAKENSCSLDIKTFRFHTNQGIPVVLNKLISMSTGCYLRLCASDDMLVEGSTQQLLDVFEGNSSLICVFGNANVINGSGDVVSDSSIAFHGGCVENLLIPSLLKRELIQRWCIAGPSVLVKKTHYENMHYDETLSIDDYDLFLSLLEKNNSVTFLNSRVCDYRIHDTNTSKTRNVSKRIGNLKSFLVIINKYIGRGVLEKDLVCIKYKTIAKICFLEKNYQGAVSNVLIEAYFNLLAKIFK